MFCEDFKIVCNPSEPDWVKYEIIYKKLYHFIPSDSATTNATHDQKKEKEDALVFL